MKNNFDIRINPRPLSGKDIERHKNFDALLKKYHSAPAPQQRPFLRKLMYFSGAIAAAILAVFVAFQFFGTESYEQQSAEHFASQPYINPPLQQVKSEFVSFNVNINQGGIYEYPSGSKLIVPAAAFVNEQGQPLEGEVVIHYREMHDFVDFFLSGIPMSYDSAGVKYALESAGMIEMFAEQNGKRVNMAPGKAVDVELISRVNVSPSLGVPPGYNIYKLDETKRNWIYNEIDRMTVLEDGLADEALDEKDPAYPAKKEYRDKMQTLQITRANELAIIENSIPKQKEPVKPEKANNASYVFDLDFDDLKKSFGNTDTSIIESELAEMYRQYEKMLWQLSPQSGITPEQLQKEFSKVTGISIRKLNNRDYELTLQKGAQSLTVIANPVLSGNDYDKALAAFNQEFDVWQKQITERETKLKAQKDALQKKLAEEQRLTEMSYENRLAELRRMGLAHEATDQVIKQKVVNRFRATGFGIWNCDRPLPPEMARLKADFKDQHGKVYEFQTGYLVDKNFNTVSQFMAKNGTMMNFNRNSQNLLWLITEDNKIAVFRPEDFNKIEKGVDAFTFVLQKIDKEIKDENDVREILYL